MPAIDVALINRTNTESMCCVECTHNRSAVQLKHPLNCISPIPFTIVYRVSVFYISAELNSALNMCSCASVVVI